MARATRSSTTHEKEKPLDPTPTARKGGSKKRKRNSIADHSEQPAAKQVRTEDGIKEEPSVEPEEHQEVEPIQPELPSSGDVPIQPGDAIKILEVLEMVDTQGLLDRVFPLPTEHSLSSDSEAGPSTGTQSYSFRALLKAPGMFPLRVLRSAVQHLFPISSHPRSRPSAPAAEQLRFCNLALSLLEAASFDSSPVPLYVESLIPTRTDLDIQTDGEDAKPHIPRRQSPVSNRKYALVQRLPTGDWWSSINSSYPTFSVDGKDLKQLPTAYADLVAIFPSSSTPAVSGEPMTLGAYAKKPLVKPLSDLTQPRRVTCGKFLDYGQFTSFAPTFEQDGVEIGRMKLGEAIWYQEIDRRRQRRRRAELESVATGSTEIGMEDTSREEEHEVAEVETRSSKQKEKMKDVDMDTALEGLLPPEQIEALKAALDTLELESAVNELLERNAQALARLEELQLLRIGDERHGVQPVKIGSEEWDIVRPRLPTDVDTAPLIPTTSALRKLHRTLPLESTGGWYGTLPPGQPSAMRDDTTIHVRSGAIVAAPAAMAVPAPAPTTPAPVAPPTKNALSTYSNYPYAGYATPGHFRGGYGTYTPTQTSSYYQNYHPPNATTQTPGASHYPNQYGTTGQQPYSYSSWYNYPAANSTQTAAGAVATSGRGTPQPTPAATASVPNNYATFFANTQQPQPQRAVANTVLSAAPGKYQSGAWANGTVPAYISPTLPPHLRSAVGNGSTPATPPATGTSPYPGYYTSYQGAQPAGR
ncbi:hypothetical protein EW026_g1198 [Hermanssonia centrifuga]|uniref:Uncharacterized protein n=1 Tax=Hermanssonia centrifuga TaxID=98765 RepID=A0A4S4KSA1_9APHY|nr:hypothetical protein EW026_g1198 [Hermanssonia centrifuga]